MKETTKDKIYKSIIEYLTITTPIAIYVGIEAHHKNDFAFFFYSPEWGIATMFLLFIGIKVYLQAIRKKQIILGKEFKEGKFQLYVYIRFISIIAVTVITFLSIEKDNGYLLFIRILLFIVSSIVFFKYHILGLLIKSEINKD